MSDYTSPPISSLPFSLGPSGYSTPSLDNVEFNFSLRPAYTSTSELQSAINVMQLYQDTTYTYTKSCRTVVVGYSAEGIQTLQLPCEYAGIRDLGASVYGDPPNADLGASLSVIANFAELVNYITGSHSASSDMVSYTRASTPEYTDLKAAIRRLDKGYEDMTKSIRGFLGIEVERELPTYIGGVPPVDLLSVMNIISIYNLNSAIEGVWLKGSYDITSQIPSTSVREYTDMSNWLHGWQITNLAGEIRPNVFTNLNSFLNAGFFANVMELPSVLTAVEGINIGSSLHSYDTRYLTASITSGFGPGDLPSYIFSIPYKPLRSTIYGCKGVEIIKDLKSIVTSYYLKDLSAYISSVIPVDLISTITSSGKSTDLQSYIMPIIIRMSKVYNVSLLEHCNLASFINYGCRLSDYKDLTSYTYAFMKKDLLSVVIGWQDDFADNLRDLKSYVNAGTYLVEDKLPLNFSVIESRYSQLDLVTREPVALYKVIDTYTLTFSNSSYKSLLSTIQGHLTHLDLTSSVNAQLQTNFTTTPSWVKPKTTEVFINLRRFEERWSRFVDIMFNSNITGENYYFYVPGADSIYKVNKDQRWTLWVTGYTKTEDNFIERSDIRRKFIFDVSKYASMDEAIRDMMDRVAEYRRFDLSSTIHSVLGIHSNLASTINSVFRYRWFKSMKSAIKATYKQESVFVSSIVPELYKADKELSSLIYGKDYDPPAGNNLEFVFEDSGYVPPTPYSDMDWTAEQII